ncbi:OpgC protein [Loktanella sp. 3ANDIMAR09]|uniref:OpgC family protein n=1 Tax=Loktanella sp. 3ANDIMAR09 TaxID=1225657 RepID=UPI0006FAAE86|nr:OpgC domain-containing protein [Loktanella sp. 3ANDIMAR09]KQI67488.1 OpgC protein [Loktanella sp. 3ANDIMAR09]
MAQSSARPDRQPASRPAGFVAPPVSRDPRIDAFRGLALVMILIDHMPGNPWEAVTVRNIGFSDAAEAFFVMSGVAAGIAYSPAVDRWLHGEARLWDGMAPMWRRAWTLYCVQIVLTLAAIGMFSWAAGVFFRGEFREMHNLAAIYENTGAALIGLPIMTYQIGYVNILPTYIVLMIAAPFILMAGLRKPWWTLTAAVLLWGFAGANGWNLPNYPGNGVWFLGPLTWQLIFIIGLLIGIRHRQGKRLVPVSRGLFAVTLAFVLFAFAWRHIPDLGAFMNHKMAQLRDLGAPANFTSHNKPMLAAPRLLHILALAYVLSCLPVVTRLCAHPVADPLRLLGRHGLLVFGLGTVLSLAGQILLRVEADVVWLPWLLPVVGVLISYAAARLADALAGRKQPQKPIAVAQQMQPPKAA